MIQFIHPVSSRRRSRSIFLEIALAVFLVFTSVHAVAQSSTQLDRVYTANSKILIEGFSTTAAYQLIGVDSSWNYLRFDSPAVPVWVESAGLNIAKNSATVRSSGLNGRIKPSVNSPIITVLDKGYSSKVLASQKGYAKILAPQKTVVAVKKLMGLAAANNKEGLVPVTPSNTNTSSRRATGARTTAPTQHVLAPGDSISLTVFGEGDLSREDLRVAENGQVSFPLLGAIKVSGLNTTEVELQVQKRLATGYVKNPQVSVSMFSYRPIFIRGSVRNTGAFPYAQGLTVSKALALAGGASPSAQFDGVKIERNGELYVEGLSIDSQYSVESGDVISVDGDYGETSTAESFIYLHGEVNSPGEYKFRRGLTVEKAVVLAGGFSMRASKRKISITRYSTEQDEPQKFKKAELYMPIEPGDVISVGASWF